MEKGILGFYYSLKGTEIMRTGYLLITTLIAIFSITSLTLADSSLGLPDDFPEITVTRTDEAAPGVYIGTIGQGTSGYNVVLDGFGYPLFYSKTETLSNYVQPNGFIAVSDNSISGFIFKDETFAHVDSFSLQGYSLDNHDVKLLPNGHVLLMAQELRYIDMSVIADGGRPDAQVTGNVIQEINAEKEVIFEWHTLDHIPLTDSFFGLTKASIDYAHNNSFNIDPLDNNLIISFRQLCQIIKVNRSTGEIIWRLGGKSNDFTFIGEHEENAPYYFVGQHDATRLPNGNILFFDNGNIGRGESTGSERDYTRIVEYHLDEVNMTATLVWEYRHTPELSAGSKGNVSRLPNGNTVILWGAAVRTSGTIITEVTPLGEVASEVTFSGTASASSLTKLQWNSPDLVQSETFSKIVTDGVYESSETGVTVSVNNVENAECNGLVIKKHGDAVRFPQFEGKAPYVLVDRVTLSVFGIQSIDVDINFNIEDINVVDPNQLTVYHRPYAGHGVFMPLTTVYSSLTQELIVLNTQPGEFIFTYPDVPEIPIAPILYAPEDTNNVNYTQPLTLEWRPKGFSRSFCLQIATDANFNDLVANESGLTHVNYTVESLQPSITYFWRANTSNDGGISDWSTDSFTTGEPMVEVIVPNDNQQWQRGLNYFIQWEDNLAEEVVIELYKGNSFVMTIASVSGSQAYDWEVDASLEAGNDYYIKVKSATDDAVFDISDELFSII